MKKVRRIKKENKLRLNGPLSQGMRNEEKRKKKETIKKKGNKEK